MIRIGHTTAVAGNERLATIAEAFEKQLGGLADLGRVSSERRFKDSARWSHGMVWCSCFLFSNGRFHRGGKGLQVADRFTEFGQSLGREIAQACRLKVMVGTHKKRTQRDDLEVEQLPRVAESDLPTAAKFVAHPVVGFPGVRDRLA
jgi:hypothetical protein